MAKRRLAKSTIKNNPFKKLSATFISLVLLFIFSIVLYFVFNKYTLENFVPKDDSRIEVTLWTDDNGSLGNSFVTGEWMDIVNTYDKFATFNKGDFAHYKKYTQDMFKGTELEPYTTDALLEPNKQNLPFVGTCLIVNNKLSGWPGFYSGTMLTGANIKKQISTHLSKDYNKLYTNSTSSMSSTSSTPSTSSSSPNTR